MGEVIRVIGEIAVNENKIKVELNGPGETKGPELIHLHKNGFRLELTKDQFVEYALSVLSARENLNYYKNRKS